MCGIAGLFQRDGQAARPDDAVRMAAAMPHRGPDGSGAWHDGPVALAHTRLAIRDRSAIAAQPMVAPGGEGVLVYNGEIFGEAPIRAALEQEGVVFRGTGDSEVVLHALARWGVERAVRRFEGMFAFAWWDARAEALWLVRDRFGIKPLHVAATAGRVAFASELRGLFALTGQIPAPDLFDLTRRLMSGYSEEIKPPFEGIENVAPGGAWKCTRGTIERRTWFDLAAHVNVDRIVTAPNDPEVWERSVREAVEEAVRSHLVSDVPVAVFTSAGVDSNLIAAIARETRPDLVAYTVDTCHWMSEAPAATRMARHLDLGLRVVPVDRQVYLRTWADAVAAHEHPINHPSQVAALPLTRAAQADGIVVVLTGEGADEVFGGYMFLARTRQRFARAGRPWSGWTASGRAERRLLDASPFEAGSYGGGRLRSAVTLAATRSARSYDLMQRLAAITPPSDRAFLAHSIDLFHHNLGWLLLRHDRLGMAASLEARVPFLSARVSDVGLHLPIAAKIRRRVGKWILKRVAERRLPRRLVYARKRGFVIPSDHHRGATALLAGGGVADLFRWPQHAHRTLLPRIEADATLRFQMVSLEIWARLYVRGERAADISEELVAASGG